MNSLLYLLVAIAIAAAAVSLYLHFKKTKIAAVVKDAQLDALGLGDKNVAT